MNFYFLDWCFWRFGVTPASSAVTLFNELRGIMIIKTSLPAFVWNHQLTFFLWTITVPLPVLLVNLWRSCRCIGSYSRSSECSQMCRLEPWPYRIFITSYKKKLPGKKNLRDLNSHMYFFFVSIGQLANTSASWLPQGLLCDTKGTITIEHEIFV